MFQDGRLLVNSDRSSEAFNTTNVGVTHTWIFLDIQSMINLLCNHEMLTDVVHMK